MASPPDRIEIATALYGAWRLICGDAAGGAYFRAGREGFWSAAWAIVLVIPAHLLTLAVHINDGAQPSLGLDDTIREAEILAIGWFGYALLAYYLMQNFGWPARFDGYMAAYFWTTVPLSYAYMALTLIRATGLLPSVLENLLALGFLVLMLWSRWFIARVGIGIKGREAVAVVVGTVMFDWMVGTVLSPLL